MKIHQFKLLSAAGLILAMGSPALGDFAFTTLDNFPASSKSEATGISGDTVVGYYVLGRDTIGFSESGGVYATISDPLASTATVAEGISGNTIVGYYIDAGGNYHGFSDTNGNYTTVDNPTATGTVITGISGSTLIGYTLSGGTIGAGFSETDGVFTPLVDSNPIPKVRVVDTIPTGISGGTIVGTYNSASSSVQFVDVDGVYSNLPFTFADGISGNTIVGYSQTSNAPPEIFGVLDVNGLITNFSDPDADPEMGTWPAGVDGNTIAGNYVDASGKSQMFLATFDVPEPGSVLLLGCGVGLLVCRRVKRGQGRVDA